ncbi:MAG: UDP-glucose/GDP-mannose dehydrogenase family protein [Microbacterium sp.]|uniref:UDP-glucose dehydrogenase family protein n=1 Tax=Microbacterium sp. TaxID=51671 RepID=UPI001AC2A01F|nr:UDP-glucose/GDP-mannose dehydrogenase family protein [Microbacterium sp.]MBN9155495.1 UDP-glucose/GDP-mannose dehydrogenase family protein [Microbacterium sp.]MBN9175567.1 UDP-glucose/GDP-mannose dehydrogenase family protein [Microbacterium sp.]
MRISVIGCGYLGAVHAAAMAELGHDVIGVDVDPEKLAALTRGEAPFFEPGLPELLVSAGSTGRLRFTDDISEVRGAQVHFIAVGTPQVKGSNAADLRFVDAAVGQLLPHLSPGDVVVGKSTVPVGTAGAIAARLTESGTGAVLAWNPEFLREGFAVKDSLTPDRIVFGLPPEPEGAAVAGDALREVYARALADDTPLVVTDYATAELVKVSANAFLATKISFINAMAEIAEVTGADVTQLADAIGFDARIGRRFLGAGVGFGGGCLPKDIRGFMARADELGRGESVAFLKEVDAINLRRRQRVVDHVLELLDHAPFGKTVAVLGLAFKPHSDDVRDSPALDVAVRLKGLGADVRATDPQAIGNARRLHPQLDYRESFEDTVSGADVVVLVTEWDEYRYLDPDAVGALVASRNVVDGRNSYDPARWRAAGWSYRGLGKP